MVEQCIQREFSLRNLNLEYELGVYRADEDTLVYGNYIQSTKAKLIEKEIREGRYSHFPLQNFAVYFPHKTSYLAAEMDIWIISTLALILMIIFFAWAIYSLLKEKRYADIKNDFINNITHEFKTPVTNISLASEMLRKRHQNSTEDVVYFKILEKENEKLRNKIDQLLSAAAYEKPTPSKFTVVDLKDILLESAETFQLKLKERGGTIRVDMDNAEHTLYGDRQLLQQAFSNIIDNAEKYSPHKPQIHIKSQKMDHGLLLSFVDSGIGIPQKWHKRIFEKFFRYQEGNIHNVKGFGLGLNFVKNVIKAHRGKISLNSAVDQGTEIKIFLPTS